MALFQELSADCSEMQLRPRKNCGSRLEQLLKLDLDLDPDPDPFAGPSNSSMTRTTSNSDRTNELNE